eukprot:CAMPEP_0201577604 /NCGR_PEP_ID=MMETSP0190_2-20130828/24051_1 /ASSEMBLY_ACC=CAM_ASM_000263 /TAXON_ID=37353 /ORGANISM="Rosalina sp." /LENGTH=342 /DNA_ID=CAMNT_0048009795 /DNA_START=275 /DNA_END=1303 /DNA_ORIENTATION=+
MDMIYPNVEEILKQRYEELDNRTRWKKGDARNVFFNNYRDWIEYEAFILEFLEANSNIASISTLGTTVQGRSIPIITLSTGGDSKPGFYIQAELHAREWLANAATMWIMNQLGEDYQEGDETVVNILNNVNIFIVPTVNIDGYIYAWTTSRMWRKNRRNNGGGSFGVDLNRNYQVNPPSGNPTFTFCGTGASSNPNSDTYCGPSAYSEPEVQASRDFVLDSSNNIQAAWDMHTFGPLVLWAWAYTTSLVSPSSEYNRIQAYGHNLRDEIQAVNGHVYVSQPAAQLYPASGTAADFFYATAGAADAVTFEGRGPGFDPAASNIIPAGEEQYAAVKFAAQSIIP